MLIKKDFSGKTYMVNHIDGKQKNDKQMNDPFRLNINRECHLFMQFLFLNKS